MGEVSSPVHRHCSVQQDCQARARQAASRMPACPPCSSHTCACPQEANRFQEFGQQAKKGGQAPPRCGAMVASEGLSETP